jgi:dynein heavy chain
VIWAVAGQPICHALGQVKSRRIPDPNKPGSKMEDFWGPAQQMLADSGFLTSLKTYDKDNMPAALMEKIHPYISDPNFEPAVVLKASKAAYGLCCWVRAMESYDKVNKVQFFTFGDHNSTHKSPSLRQQLPKVGPKR